ncbi:MAG: winged helix-turn-helix domain-containing protein [Nitrososphaerota archaeon]|nr:winged helix-turn-helix domain-containing protein [Nitrososphaerota archaeon]MDG6932708.1 winged helix-turn-helix domain-containing protein [Nitrososphaerota archaeon]MDG6935506.1 winged helix-turn-helix domain-containing protein [Nitrososphaerota archaeon]MDG6943401.1 winged helix-turn-helix domain-containing protein [Nitrososphaerota archaeon]
MEPENVDADTQERIIKVLAEDPEIKRAVIALKIGRSASTVSSNIKKMIKNERIFKYKYKNEDGAVRKIYVPSEVLAKPLETGTLKINNMKIWSGGPWIFLQVESKDVYEKCDITLNISSKGGYIGKQVSWEWGKPTPEKESYTNVIEDIKLIDINLKRITTGEGKFLPLNTLLSGKFIINISLSKLTREGMTEYKSINYYGIEDEKFYTLIPIAETEEELKGILTSVKVFKIPYEYHFLKIIASNADNLNMLSLADQLKNDMLEYLQDKKYITIDPFKLTDEGEKRLEEGERLDVFKTIEINADSVKKIGRGCHKDVNPVPSWIASLKAPFIADLVYFINFMWPNSKYKKYYEFLYRVFFNSCINANVLKDAMEKWRYVQKCKELSFDYNLAVDFELSTEIANKNKDWIQIIKKNHFDSLKKDAQKVSSNTFSDAQLLKLAIWLSLKNYAMGNVEQMSMESLNEGVNCLK